MSFNASRLSIYAVISAIESDLREAIEFHLNRQRKIEDIFGAKIFEKIFVRLQKEQGTATNEIALGEIVHFLDFDETVQVLNANRDLLPPEIAEAMKALTTIFQKLAPIRNRVMHARPLEYDDLATCLDTVEQMRGYKVLGWRSLNSTLSDLRNNPAFVFGLSIPIVNEDRTMHNLPTPDFDETGVIGRRGSEEQLLRYILGAQPVITVVGEGGQGKTALALKVAYTLLDAAPQRFDAIVWTTAKTTQINAQEIIKIRGAITDSLGMLHAIQSELIKQPANDPVDDIIEYLQAFRILLVLDNLETVRDSKIDAFLDRLPTGSKVLITSRIGLGDFERRLQLGPLEDFDSVRLLTSLTKVRGIRTIEGLSRATLITYCKRMKNNPGFIKWFISALQAGKRPEEVLQHTDLFLDFCMSNVYDFLTPQSRELLNVFQTIPQQLSQPELKFIADIEILALQNALYQLTSTNMVRMGSVGSGTASETKYALTELARDYLAKHHPVLRKTATRLRARFREIQSASYIINEASRTNLFSFLNIAQRSQGEVLVGRYLLDALDAIRRKELNVAFTLIESARTLAPQFYEVHRVAAYAHAESGNLQEADECYLAALELEGKSAALHYWYGQFLARHLQDSARALTEYSKAEILAPGEPQVVLECARCHLFLNKFDKARELILKLEELWTLRPQLRRMAFDLKLQINVMESELCFRQKDVSGAAELIGRSMELIRAFDISLYDKYVSRTVARTYRALDRCTSHIVDVTLLESVEDSKDELARLLAKLGVPTYEAQLERRSSGQIDRVPSPLFGFIRGDDDKEYYFSMSSTRLGTGNPARLVGKRVKFELGMNAQGVCALNVMEDTNLELDLDDQIEE